MAPEIWSPRAAATVEKTGPPKQLANAHVAHAEVNAPAGQAQRPQTLHLLAEATAENASLTGLRAALAW